MTFNRRFILGAIAGSSFFGLPAVALTQAEATKLIDNISADLRNAIDNARSDADRFQRFEKIFAKYADVPRIAQKALGPTWRDASKAQRSAYVKAFQGFMARFYGKRFREFKGFQITVTGAEKAPGGFLVDSRVQIKSGSPFDTQWHVISSGGRDRMFNMYIEGVSILADMRVQIGSMLDKRGGDIDKLTAHLNSST
ncbi:MAG: ABC transporter substrate-binding protein [Pseudomonadota bacterium]